MGFKIKCDEKRGIEYHDFCGKNSNKVDEN
jgi:hypothetical protein